MNKDVASRRLARDLADNYIGTRTQFQVSAMKFPRPWRATRKVAVVAAPRVDQTHFPTCVLLSGRRRFAFSSLGWPVKVKLFSIFKAVRYSES